MHDTITLPIFVLSNSMKGLIKTKRQMKNFKITYTDYDTNEEGVEKTTTMFAETQEQAEKDCYYDIDAIEEIPMPEWEIYIEHLPGTAHGELKQFYCYAYRGHEAIQMMKHLSKKLSMTPNNDAFADALERVVVYHNGVEQFHHGFMGALREGFEPKIKFAIPVDADFSKMK